MESLTRVVPGIVDVVVLGPPLAPTTGQPPSPGVPARRSPYPWQVLTLQRGANTRCTGAWEIVHGRIEPGERPEHAAAREVLEETGLTARRLYSITVNPFYLHQSGTVQLALVFAAVVDAGNAVVLGPEHGASQWRSVSAAARILAWPREREALTHVSKLLKYGDAGPVEDVLRIF